VSSLLFERSSDDRLIAGVCGGIAARLAVDATLVRLVFAILALAGGAGILVYLALWIYARGRRALPAAILFAVASAAILFALGLSGTALLGATLLVAGFVTVLAAGGSLRPGGSVPRLGVVLLVAGAVIFLGRSGASGGFLAPGAVAGALVLVVGPWLWQLTTERTERIRLQERAEVAARIHDSVLQTLALIQRHAGDPVRVATIARRQERELRRWLYGSGVSDAESLVAALADTAADVEELHGVPVELATAGDTRLDDGTRQLVLAAREAMTNAAKFSGAAEIAVYAEVGADTVSVFVRDRGAGFDRTRSLPTAAASRSRSKDGSSARGGRRRSSQRPGPGPRSSFACHGANREAARRPRRRSRAVPRRRAGRDRSLGRHRRRGGNRRRGSPADP
jgi:signal transduction histidine kinase